MNIGTFKKAGIVAAGFALSAGANALVMEPVTEWGADISTSWVLTGPGAPVFEDNQSTNSGTTAASATILSWGSPTGARSSLVIGDPALTGLSIFTNAGPTPTATITHFNNTLRLGTDSLLSATLMSTLTLTPFDPAGPGQAPLVATVPILFFETENTETSADCGFTSTSACDDIFVVVPADLSDTFVYENFVYTTTIVADGLGILDASQCAEVGIQGQCFGLTTQENQDNPVRFAVSIDARPVPVPATAALVGLGLLGFGAAARRRRSQA